MDKSGRRWPPATPSLEAEPRQIFGNWQAKGGGRGCRLHLDRPRHPELIAKFRTPGADMLIADGDVSGVVATVWPESGIDIYMGSGGAREGVLAAAALACVGGQMQGRLIVRNDDEKRKAADFTAGNPGRIYTVADMVGSEVTFAATGVTDGVILGGTKRRYGVAVTHSLVMRSRSGTLHFVEAYHDFAKGASIARLGS